MGVLNRPAPLRSASFSLGYGVAKHALGPPSSGMLLTVTIQPRLRDPLTAEPEKGP